jgi:hypothetical protein
MSIKRMPQDTSGKITSLANSLNSPGPSFLSTASTFHSIDNCPDQNRTSAACHALAKRLSRQTLKNQQCSHHAPDPNQEKHENNGSPRKTTAGEIKQNPKTIKNTLHINPASIRLRNPAGIQFQHKHSKTNPKAHK